MKEQQTLGRLVRTAVPKAVAIALVLVLLASLGPAPAGAQSGSPSQGVPQQEMAGDQPPAGLPDDWLATVQREIERSEYEITWQEITYLADLPAAYQAPNRAHNLRTYFAPAGPRVIRRTETVPTWEWGLALTGYGADGQIGPVGAAELVVAGNRIDYRRGDPSTGSGPWLTEWYVNDETGLEQCFSLAGPPPDAGSQPAEIVLELAMQGNLTPALSGDGATIDLAAADGSPVLHYGGLRAADATGRELGARLELDGQRVRLVVETADALFPIAIDPTIVGLSGAASRSAEGGAADGSTITGLSPTANWSVEGGDAGIELGYSVATAGDVNGDDYSDVIIGAPYYDGGKADQGRVYVYYGSASGLGLTPWVKASGQAGAQFGFSVATAGDMDHDLVSEVIVGAPFWDGGQTDEGGIWVYKGRVDLGPDPVPWIHYEHNVAGENLGFSVAPAGNVNGDYCSDVILGAPHAPEGGTDRGIAIVLYGSESGWDGLWLANSEQTGSGFGSAVNTAGDVNCDGHADVIVGAWSYEHDGVDTDKGAAFVWYGSEDGLNEGVYGTPSNAAWKVESLEDGAHYGSSVSTAGDVNGNGCSDVVVGARYFSHGQTSEGGIWVYHGSSSGLSQDYAVSIEGNSAGAWFGSSVGIAGDVNGDGYADIIVGAPYYMNPEPREGGAWVYYGSSTGVVTTAAWHTEGYWTTTEFGFAVATAGDVNGDGYSDVIVGAPCYSNPADDEGVAFVYHGAADGLATAPGWTKASGRTDGYFGTSVGTAGDVNGDGYADVIVGAPGYDEGQVGEGHAFVYHGSASGPNVAPAWHGEGDMDDADYGTSVGTAGDVNGDGYSDVIVGAPGYDAWGRDRAGAAFVYKGSSSGLSTGYVPLSGGAVYDGLGYSVGAAGDVNGDGYGDVIVGVPGYDAEQIGIGQAYVYYGSVGGPDIVADWHDEGDAEGAAFGVSVGTAGDVNGDGYSDVIVGAPYRDTTYPESGIAYVYYGAGSGLGTSPVLLYVLEANQHFGWSVGTAGDVNGDGYADVAVGAPTYTNGQHEEGRAYVYYGSAHGVGGSPWTKEPEDIGAGFGYSVGTAGDVNGDGYADLIVGAPWCSFGGEDNEGWAFVYHGSAAGLIAAPGWSDDSNQAYAQFGYSVGTAGDTNGDGYADVIVGANAFSGGHTHEGQAYVYYGGGGRGVTLRPRQMRYNGLTPIAPLGKSDQADSFGLLLNPRAPFGRTRVALDVEIKPLGIPFDGSEMRRYWEWYNTTSSDPAWYNIYELSPGTAYHWRVRWRYYPAYMPFMPAGRWLTVPWNGWNETDFRTKGSRIFLPVVMRNY